MNNGDIWKLSDSCHYVFREVVGDFDFVTRLAESSNTADWTKTGIMVRNSVGPSSRNLLVGFSGRMGVIYQRRLSEDKEATQEPPKQNLKAPGWIKLTRRGSTFIGYYSVDGSSWTEVSQENLDLTKEAVVGLAAKQLEFRQAIHRSLDNISLTKP